MKFPAYFELEGLKFSLPSFTLLAGPMAAAKPLFAQKFIANFLNKIEGANVFYLATSAPIEGILRNLQVFGLNEERRNITFFDYDPAVKELREEEDNYYKGDYSNPKILNQILDLANENAVIVIPSFTLLLVNAEKKEELAETLLEAFKNKKLILFVAVNSEMFQDLNGKLIGVSDNFLEFFKKGKEIFIKVVKFKGKYDKEEKEFRFKKEIFTTTKKEVVEKTSNVIKKKKAEKIKPLQ
ncbi:MAG: RAD55 family ATPase [Thermoanaerobacteraceae bacterium]